MKYLNYLRWAFWRKVAIAIPHSRLATDQYKSASKKWIETQLPPVQSAPVELINYDFDVYVNGVTWGTTVTGAPIVSASEAFKRMQELDRKEAEASFTRTIEMNL